MMTRAYASFLLICAVLMTGCTTFETTPFDAATHANLDSVVVVEPATPEALDVTVLAPVGANFGLIGAIATEAGLNAKRKTLAAATTSQNYSYLDQFNTLLDEKLSGAGYNVNRTDYDRDTSKLAFLKDYSAIDADGAILDIYVNFIGYAAAGSGTEYRPTLMLSARLVDQPGNVLFADQVFYNPLGATGDAITLDPDPQYTFAEFDQIGQEPDRAVAGINAAIDSVLTELARSLEK